MIFSAEHGIKRSICGIDFSIDIFGQLDQGEEEMSGAIIQVKSLYKTYKTQAGEDLSKVNEFDEKAIRLQARNYK